MESLSIIIPKTDNFVEAEDLLVKVLCSWANKCLKKKSRGGFQRHFEALFKLQNRGVLLEAKKRSEGKIVLPC